MRKIHRLISLMLLPVFLVSCSFGKSQPGSGSSNSVSDPAAGLDKLPAYQATYTLSFDGLLKGTSSQWSTAYNLSVGKDPQVWVLTYQQTGLGTFAPYRAMQGFLQGVDYSRANADSPCVASFANPQLDPATVVPDLPVRLPKVSKMTSVGTEETVNGILTQPYTFDAAGVTSKAGAVVTGKLWLSKENGTLVKLDMSLTGGTDFFDADTSGTFTWAYQVQPLDATKAAILPVDCPLPLPKLPAVQDTSKMMEFPGYVSFETSLSPDDLLAFYQKNLPAGQFSLVDDIRSGTEAASMIYSAGGQNITFSAVKGPPTRVTITGQSAQQLAAVTPQPTRDLSAQSTQIYGSPQMRVINSLSLLTGQDPKPSVFDSYHMDSHQISPRWSEQTGSVLAPENWFNVDVQGKNVHFTNTDKNEDGSQNTSEVYMIEDKQYDVQNGTAVEGLGLSSMAWIMWPLDPMLLLGVGSSKATSTGTETVDGRPAEVFQLSGTTADDLSGLFSGFGMLITRMDGKVWVDSQTGALLKAQINYEADIKDSTGAVKGSRTGLLELTISKINAVTVQLP